jgi:hypothetical protein
VATDSFERGYGMRVVIDGGSVVLMCEHSPCFEH